mmetsp:Transcript_17450/g.43517  ORF Transcript_17450/g.43517 Transcript_17450/m.43517 type:complete len:213 (-) Transcript_17450:566-1204(-)
MFPISSRLGMSTKSSARGSNGSMSGWSASPSTRSRSPSSTCRLASRSIAKSRSSVPLVLNESKSERTTSSPRPPISFVSSFRTAGIVVVVLLFVMEELSVRIPSSRVILFLSFSMISMILSSVALPSISSSMFSPSTCSFSLLSTSWSSCCCPPGCCQRTRKKSAKLMRLKKLMIIVAPMTAPLTISERIVSCLANIEDGRMIQPRYRQFVK